MSDTTCPYCNNEVEINHDDGYGYEENELHQQECSNCGKTFTYTTSIILHHQTYKADCLNEDGEHKFKPTITFPRIFTKMECTDCGERRDPTEEEWVKINKREFYK
jgi:Zn ribbon nucleic-acid-binding protein